MYIRLRDPAPHLLRFSWNGYTVAKAFRDRRERDLYREHIVRVWGAKIIK